MKAEINQEWKAKFFALYWGQPVYNRIGWPGLKVNAAVGVKIDLNEQFALYDSHHNNPEAEGTKTFLQLKPLSAITDEDAINLTAVIFSNREDKHLFKPTGVTRFNGNFKVQYGWKDRAGQFVFSEQSLTVEQYQYLQQNGYALDWYCADAKRVIPVSEQIELGWIKLVK